MTQATTSGSTVGHHERPHRLCLLASSGYPLPIITFKNELKRIFEEKFFGKIGTNFSPFFTRIEENFDGKTGVLFVGKADNIEGRPQSIEAAFSQINGDYIRQIAEGCSGYHRSAYVRTSHEIAKELKKKGMTCFARTNLYKLSNTKKYTFGSEHDEANLEIFQMELEALKPKYVVLLTSGLEVSFLNYISNKLGQQPKTIAEVNYSYQNRGKIRTKALKCIKIGNLNSIFITALHPQGKPSNMAKVILDLIDKAQC